MKAIKEMCTPLTSSLSHTQGLLLNYTHTSSGSSVFQTRFITKTRRMHYIVGEPSWAAVSGSNSRFKYHTRCDTCKSTYVSFCPSPSPIDAGWTNEKSSLVLKIEHWYSWIPGWYYNYRKMDVNVQCFKVKVLNFRYCCSSVLCALQFAYSSVHGSVHGTHLLPFGSLACMAITYARVHVCAVVWHHYYITCIHMCVYMYAFNSTKNLLEETRTPGGRMSLREYLKNLESATAS